MILVSKASEIGVGWVHKKRVKMGPRVMYAPRREIAVVTNGKPSDASRELAKLVCDSNSPVTIRTLAGGGDALTLDGSLEVERT